MFSQEDTVELTTEDIRKVKMKTLFIDLKVITESYMGG